MTLPKAEQERRRKAREAEERLKNESERVSKAAEEVAAKEAAMAAKEAEFDARMKEREEALEAKMQEFEVRMARASDHSTDHREVQNDFQPRQAPIELGDIGHPGGVEQIPKSDLFKDAIEMEAFMNEIVTIEIQLDGNENSPDMAIPNVNGMNQPILRGVPSKVKRKYVEALARAKITTYRQETPDASKPEAIQMVPTPSYAFPFSVLHDPNPKGPAWLAAIKNETY